jgi:hypothetical protein
MWIALKHWRLWLHHGVDRATSMVEPGDGTGHMQENMNGQCDLASDLHGEGPA